MKWLLCLNLVFFLMLTSCIPMSPSNLDFDGNREPSSVMSVEKQLWTQNCASCHTNAQSGLPSKLYASVSDINVGIATVNSMKDLSRLTNNEVTYISKFLNEEAILRAQKRQNKLKVKSKTILSTRNFTISKLKSIYVSSANNAADTQISNIINIIASYPGAFGGTCVHAHETCTGESTENYSASMNMDANVTRSGLLIKVCMEMHNNSSAILNAMNYSGLAITDEPTDLNVNKMIEAFVPGHDDEDGVLLKELKSTYTKAMDSGMNKKDAWNMVSYVLCSTPVFEKI
jgi:hypothetical protein